MPYILDNKVLPLDIPFVYNDIQYPSNWLRLSTDADRAALGITWRDEQPRPDDRFYYVTENADGSYTSTPKDLGGLKTSWTAQINQTAYTLLATSDWYVVRKAETSAAIPKAWTDYRSAVRTQAADTITAIVGAANLDAFIAVVTNVQWPLDPNAPTANK